MRSLFLFVLSFCCCFSLFAQIAVNQKAVNQKAVAFHATMKAGTVYRQTMETETNIAFNYDSMSQELKDALQSNPETSKPKKIQILMETETHCGKAEAGTGLIPVRMTVTKDTGMMMANILPVGTNFYGHVSPGKLPVFDSTDMSGNAQMQTMLATVKNLGFQVALPDTTLSVGQTYTQVIPIDLPGGGMNMKMVMTMAYTLKGYSKDTAGFDITVKGTLDMGSNSQAPITGTATGDGHTVYDRKTNYFTDTQMDMTMQLAINQGGNVMHMVIGMNQLLHCVVSKDK